MIMRRIHTVNLKGSDFLVLALICIASLQFVYLTSFGSKKVVALYALVVIGAVSVWLIYRKHGNDPSFVCNKMFPVVFASLAVLFALFFPAGSAPDEPSHFYSCYKYSSLLLNGDEHVIRVEDESLFDSSVLDTEINNESWDAEKQHLFAEDGYATESISAIEGSVEDRALKDLDFWGNNPQARAFSVIGIVLARLLGVGCSILFYLGRLTSVLISAVFVTLAVRCTPIGKPLFMTVSLLPMSLHLFASYSYDSAVISFSMLLTALILRAALGEGAISKRLMAAIAVFSVLLAPCKVVYTVIVLLALFIPNVRFGSKRAAIACKIGLLALCALSIAAVRIPALIEFASSGATSSLRTVNGVTGETDSGVLYGLADILANPYASFCMLWRTIETNSQFWLYSMVGDSLGWLQGTTSAPDIIPIGLLALLTLSFLRSRDDNIVLPSRMRVVAILLATCAAFGVIVSLWLSWTYVTETYIQGVQGRYFLPLLPMALLALRPKCVQLHCRTQFPLLISLWAIDIMMLEYISAVSTLL